MKHSKRLKVIKGIFAAALILMLFIPSSVNHPQIDMRALVTAIGIDYSDKGVKASAQIMLPVEGGGAIGSGEVIAGEGRNLSEALENISTSLGRKLELAHCGIIVLGKEAAQKGTNKHLEYLLSSGVISPETNLTLSANKDAEEFLTILSQYSHKLDLSNLLRYTDLGAQNYSHGLVHFLHEINSKSNASAMPCIKMGYESQNEGGESEEFPDKNEGDENKEFPDKNDGGENKGGGETNQRDLGSEGGKEEDKKQALIKNAQMTAVFSGDKLVNIYGADETYGLAWLDKDTKKGYVFVDEVQIGEELVRDIPLKLRKKTAKISTKINGETPEFTIKLTVKLELEDRHGLNKGDGISKKPVSTEAQRALNTRAKEIITSSLTKAFESSRKDNADIMLVRDAFFKNHHKEYKRLSANNFDFLNECDFKVDIKININ